MAVKKKVDNLGLPLDTIIEVVAINGDRVVKHQMTYGKSLEIKRSKGWTYSSYQKGFCSMKDN